MESWTASRAFVGISYLPELAAVGAPHELGFASRHVRGNLSLAVIYPPSVPTSKISPSSTKTIHIYHQDRSLDPKQWCSCLSHAIWDDRPNDCWRFRTRGKVSLNAKMSNYPIRNCFPVVEKVIAVIAFGYPVAMTYYSVRGEFHS